MADFWLMDNNQNPHYQHYRETAFQVIANHIQNLTYAELLNLLEEIVAELQNRRLLDLLAVRQAQEAPLDPIEDEDTSSESLSD